MDWIQKNFKTIIYISFLVPILLVAFVSISHVTTWYGLTNPVSWAIYLSFGIEIAALSALAAISAQMGKKVYVPFGIVTLIQFIGNIFFAYQYIDINSEQFKDWVELVDPIVSYIGVESGNVASHKRFLSLFSGGMLPIISLSFLHMLVKFEEEEKNKKKEVDHTKVDIDELSTLVGIEEREYDENKYVPTEEDLVLLEERLRKINEEKFGNLTEDVVGVEEQIVEPKQEENIDVVPEPEVSLESIQEENIDIIPEPEVPLETISIQTQVEEPAPITEPEEIIEVEPDFYSDEKPDYNISEEQNNPRRLSYLRSH